MQAIREIRLAGTSQISLTIPPEFVGQQIEIIILPLQAQPAPKTHKKSLRGCLKQYAKPELIADEKSAWQNAAVEKYESR